jgi:hypothetical protein
MILPISMQRKGNIEKAGVTEFSAFHFMPIFKLHGFFKLMSLNMYQKFQVKAF